MISELHDVSETESSAPQWMCLPQNARVISDVQRTIVEALFPKCGGIAVQLLLDGTILPPSERADIIRDEDVLTIRPATVQSDSIQSAAPDKTISKPLVNQNSGSGSRNVPPLFPQNSSAVSSPSESSSSTSSSSLSTSSSAVISASTSTFSTSQHERASLGKAKASSGSDSHRSVSPENEESTRNDPRCAKSAGTSRISKIKRNRRSRHRRHRRNVLHAPELQSERKHVANGMSTSDIFEDKDDARNHSVPVGPQKGAPLGCETGVLLRREKLIHASPSARQNYCEPGRGDFGPAWPRERARGAKDPKGQSCDASTNGDVAVRKTLWSKKLGQNNHDALAERVSARVIKRGRIRRSGNKYLHESQTNTSVFLPALENDIIDSDQTPEARNFSRMPLHSQHDDVAAAEQDVTVLKFQLQMQRLKDALKVSKAGVARCDLRLCMLGSAGQPRISDWITIDARPGELQDTVDVCCPVGDRHVIGILESSGARSLRSDGSRTFYVVERCAVSAMCVHMVRQAQNALDANEKSPYQNPDESRIPAQRGSNSPQALNRRADPAEKAPDSHRSPAAQRDSSQLPYEKAVALNMLRLLSSVKSALSTT